MASSEPWQTPGFEEGLAVGFVEEQVFARHANLFLCVSDFNDGAQRLYARHGFVEVGRLNDYLVTGHAELLSRKTRGSIFGR